MHISTSAATRRGRNCCNACRRSSGSSRCASVAEKPIVRAADGGFLEFFGRTTSHDLLTGFKAAGASSSTDDAATTTAILLDPLRDASFMAACNAHGWSMLKPYGTEHFITYGRDYVRSQLAMGLAGELAEEAPLQRPASEHLRVRVYKPSCTCACMHT